MKEQLAGYVATNVSCWPKAHLRFRRNLIRTLKFRRAAMGAITAGGILQVPVDNLLHFTDSNRP